MKDFINWNVRYYPIQSKLKSCTANMNNVCCGWCCKLSYTWAWFKTKFHKRCTKKERWTWILVNLCLRANEYMVNLWLYDCIVLSNGFTVFTAQTHRSIQFSYCALTQNMTVNVSILYNCNTQFNIVFFFFQVWHPIFYLFIHLMHCLCTCIFMFVGLG